MSHSDRTAVTNKRDILDHLEDPAQLEAWYRASPGQFELALQAALAEQPDSIVLRVWQARLQTETRSSDTSISGPWVLLRVILLAIGTGALVKLPDYTALQEDWWYSRFAVSLVLFSVIVFLLGVQRTPSYLRSIVLASSAAGFIYLALLPSNGSDKPGDSIILAFIHIPLAFLTLGGIAFMGDRFRRSDARVEFLRYCGETAVLSVLILLGGVVLSGATVALFNLIDLSIMDWYVQWVVVMGLCASPLVATYLYETVFGGRICKQPGSGPRLKGAPEGSSWGQV